jgi:hypothetical protein
MRNSPPFGGREDGKPSQKCGYGNENEGTHSNSHFGIDLK